MQGLEKIQHVIVIYQENWSFDSLYGRFPGADGLANAGERIRQVKPDGTPDHPNGAQILQNVQKKQAILRSAWLSEVGHKRPGVPAGLPLADAEKKAAPFDAEARSLAKMK